MLSKFSIPLTIALGLSIMAGPGCIPGTFTKKVRDEAVKTAELEGARLTPEQEFYAVDAGFKIDQEKWDRYRASPLADPVIVAVLNETETVIAAVVVRGYGVIQGVNAIDPAVCTPGQDMSACRAAYIRQLSREVLLEAATRITESQRRKVAEAGLQGSN